MANTSPTATHPANQDATSPAKQADKPLATFRSGRVSAAVYGKKRTLPNGKSVTFMDVSIRKAFKTAEGEWDHTHTLGAGDLLDAAFVLTRCAAYITDARQDEVDE